MVHIFSVKHDGVPIVESAEEGVQERDLRMMKVKKPHEIQGNGPPLTVDITLPLSIAAFHPSMLSYKASVQIFPLMWPTLSLYPAFSNIKLQVIILWASISLKAWWKDQSCVQLWPPPREMDSLLGQIVNILDLVESKSELLSSAIAALKQPQTIH